MTQWRPKSSIRVVAVGLHWRAGRLLAAEVRDDSGRLKGVRPLGGGVEFGETWHAALVREFNEELGVTPTVKGIVGVLENIFVHEGATGHEVVFVSELDISGAPFEEQDSISFLENDGMSCVARWFDLAELDVDGGPELYPTGLKELLLTRTKSHLA